MHTLIRLLGLWIVPHSKDRSLIIRLHSVESNVSLRTAMLNEAKSSQAKPCYPEPQAMPQSYVNNQLVK